MSNRSSILRPSWRSLVFGFSIAFSCSAAPTPNVVITGLQSPSKIIQTGEGHFLVTETGTGTNAGSVSYVTTGGLHKTILTGLPSGPSAPDGTPDGPNGLAWSDGVLYLTNGEGDTHVVGPRPNTLLPNPAGPSSPLFSTVLRITFCDPIDQITDPFILTSLQQTTLADGSNVTLKNSSGQTATIFLVSALRVDRPDPGSIYRNTHLYGVAASRGPAKALYLADAGNNAIWRINAPAGTPRLVVRFPNTPNPAAPAGPPTSEAVPTSVHEAGNQLIVSLLAGAPFVPGTSRIVLVDPQTGKFTPVVTGLSSTIDFALRQASGTSPELFALEYSTSLATGAPGQLLRVTASGKSVLVDNLVTPSSLIVDESSKSILITDQSEGKLLSVPLP